jgi:hypothetical protein
VGEISYYYTLSFPLVRKVIFDYKDLQDVFWRRTKGNKPKRGYGHVIAY